MSTFVASADSAKATRIADRVFIVHDRAKPPLAPTPAAAPFRLATSFFSGKTYRGIWKEAQVDLRTGREVRAARPEPGFPAPYFRIDGDGRLFRDDELTFCPHDRATGVQLQRDAGPPLRVYENEAHEECEPLVRPVAALNADGSVRWRRFFVVKLPVKHAGGSSRCGRDTTGFEEVRGIQQVMLGDGTALLQGDYVVLRVKLDDGSVGPVRGRAVSVDAEAAIELKRKVKASLPASAFLQEFGDALERELFPK